MNLLAIVVFSRLLSSEQYGHYALVLAGTGFVGAVLFLWIRLSILRFLPSSRQEPRRLVAPLVACFLFLAALTAAAGLLSFTLIRDPVWRLLIAVGIPVMWAQGWFEIQRELARSELAPLRYGLLSGLRATTALVVGAGLIGVGLGAPGALLGLLLGSLLAPIAFSPRRWKWVRPVAFRLTEHGYLLAYGLPLAVNYVLMWVLTTSDRVLLGWLLTVEATGQYSVAYDLASQAIGVLLMIVSLAAYPLAVRALERYGRDEARAQLARNLRLLLAVGVPGAVGLWLVAPELASVLLGQQFREAATRLIPWVAVATLLAGVKSYHFDLAFHLGRRTMSQVWVALVAAAVNLGLNLLWIPRFGLMGAAYATVVSYALAVVGSWLVGRRVFRLPWDWSASFKVALATIAMVVVLSTVPAAHTPATLFMRTIVGTVAYLLIAFALDLADVRTSTGAWLGRVRGAES